jgi:hypothetical protein
MRALATRRRRPQGPRRRFRHEGGAVAVEAALVTPVLIFLVFGILEFGFFFKDWLAVSNAVRAGVRIASAEPRVATYAADAAANVAREGNALRMANVEEVWVYRADTDGLPVGNVSGFDACSDCAKFSWDEVSETFTLLSNSWGHTEHNACQGDVNRMNVGVYLKYQHDSVTNMFFDDAHIGDHAVMSFEPIPTTRGCRP